MAVEYTGAIAETKEGVSVARALGLLRACPEVDTATSEPMLGGFILVRLKRPLNKVEMLGLQTGLRDAVAIEGQEPKRPHKKAGASGGRVSGRS